MVHSGLVEAINAHVFEVAVPVRIKGYNGPPLPAVLMALFVIDIVGYMVDEGNPLLVKKYISNASDLEDARFRRISVVVALAISEKEGEIMILGNNIGERVNWTVHNSSYVLFHWEQKLCTLAMHQELRRRLMVAYHKLTAVSGLEASLAAITLTTEVGPAARLEKQPEKSSSN